MPEIDGNGNSDTGNLSGKVTEFIIFSDLPVEIMAGLGIGIRD